MLRIPTNRPPTHPGEMLAEEFMKPLGLSSAELSRRTGMPVTRVRRLVRGEIGATTSDALRLGRFFGTTPEFWINGQRMWDLYHAMHGPAGREI